MDEDDLQSHEELAAQFGPGSAAVACWEFIAALFDQRDWVAAWALMTPEYRLSRAQAWCYNNRHDSDFQPDPEIVAVELAGAAGSRHHLWPEFAEGELHLFHEAHPDWHEAQYGMGSRPRVVGIDLELLVLVPTEGDVVLIERPTLVPHGVVLMMRHVDGRWLVAQFGGDRLPVPGWPPDLYPAV